jgi:hypothetical protein
MPTEDVSHRDIYERLAQLSEKVNSVLLLMVERKEEVARINKDLNVLFDRQRTLENRMAQVVILGGVAALLLPIVGSWVTLKLVIPIAVERQQEQKP